MLLSTGLPLLAAFLSLSLASFVLWQDHRSWIHRLFALGMVAQAGEAALLAISMHVYARGTDV
jgi:hypothetical protein